ncbi:protein tyrosine phosphatase [Janibacter sp. Soil728]|uniref:tyrosine-protein phosphatase n=1 Tax=Janibacter sp. Soil728 TaxID=1736393 RepID=UPI0006FA7973|nr:tyrosine-protein phosphatase [Janibacter sp. Soil728]KRE37929.1 protein tyrosine phosphatase [Janibacter sp. Soil728]
MTRWIDLDGVVNMRDLGGLPTRDGRRTREGRLIRSDNLQDLSEGDVARLIDEVGVTDVVDLRSNVEYEVTGQGPLRATPLVHHHFSLLAEDQDPDKTVEEALALRWGQEESAPRDGAFWGRHYTGYLTKRPDSVAAALAAVRDSAGGAVVHCAAGKDRTGTVVGMALSVAGVPEEEIISDYVRTAERLERIMERLVRVEPYNRALPTHTLEEQLPRAESMEAVLTHLDEGYGGAVGWLTASGWTDADVEALRVHLTA